MFGCRAFTLIELLASTALLMLLGVLSYSILASTSSAWKSHKARVGAFEGARAAFESLTTRLSQATLNTYWDYDDPADPQRYFRQSELHFVSGHATSLLPSVGNATLDAVFFIAPLGFTDNAAFDPLNKMLTACGFYVRFSDDPNRPDFLSGRIPSRYRFRLFQFLQPGEQLEIYNSPTGTAWFEDNVASWSFSMAENVLGLVIRAKYPTGSGDRMDYNYNSRNGSRTASTPMFNQLPPVVAVTMVVMDEDSARRLESGSAPPDVLPAANLFTNPAYYEDDLATWENKLAGKNVAYRVFSAEIPIRGAKWSSDP